MNEKIHMYYVTDIWPVPEIGIGHWVANIKFSYYSSVIKRYQNTWLYSGEEA